MNDNPDIRRVKRSPSDFAVLSLILATMPWFIPLALLPTMWILWLFSDRSSHFIGGFVNSLFVMMPLVTLGAGVGAISVGIHAIRHMKNPEQGTKGKGLAVAGIVIGSLQLLGALYSFYYLTKVH